MRNRKVHKRKNIVLWAAVLTCLLFVMILTGCGEDENLFPDLKPEENETVLLKGMEEAPLEVQNEEIPELPKTIFIHVCGAVSKPGVYELPAGSRLFEAVETAGGFTGEACTDYLNMAESLEDGEKIKIPTLEEAESLIAAGIMPDDYGERMPGKGNASAAGGDFVNINTAGIAELCTLPGIGETRAKSILEYREKQGGFKKKEDIMQVSGIGQKMYEKIEKFISIQ